ncbi:MAG: hypothetical protein LUG89_03065, partial [Methanosphaera sp.]|nr:hypothetical protein [Methanosphaera sp.]
MTKDRSKKCDNYASDKSDIDEDNLSLKEKFYKHKFKIILLLLAIIILFIIFTIQINNNYSNNTTTVQIANTSIGSVTKTGPYGNTSSDVKIAYVLGVHPRENGSHTLFKQAFLEDESDLQYCYYIYQINVTANATDFNQSRSNGQQLAYDYVVDDIINDSFDFVMDIHYCDGTWGEERFVFTSVKENILSYNISYTMAQTFEWLDYYEPSNPTSPEYLMSPLNNAGITTILYESYMYDDNNTTLEYDHDVIEFID